MIENGRPRFWIGWYDRWNLALPIGLVGVLGWLLLQPRPILPPSPPAQAVPRIIPLGQTTLESPVSGTQVRADRMPNVEGRAVPGTVVVLFYSRSPSLERRELGRVRVGSDGRYRFGLSGFPAGGYVLQAIAYAADGRTAASPPVDLWVNDARPARRTGSRP